MSMVPTSCRRPAVRSRRRRRAPDGSDGMSDDARKPTLFPRSLHVACALTALAALVPVCARAEGDTPCRAPARSMQAIELMFGRSVAGRLVVGEREWERFLAREITPRFPDGLSVVDAAGQYKTVEGLIAHEPSKIVIIIAPEGSETQDRIAVIEAAYKKQFRQQKVVVVTRTVCASF
jgi:Protein of unknown function (DUF3574)